MSSADRRAAARRRAWGRGPMILRFEPLEGRALLSVTAGGSGIGSGNYTQTSSLDALPDLVAARISAPSNLDWDQQFTLTGLITNQGLGMANKPFTVDVYASPDTKIVPGAVKLGSFDVPTALGPRQSYAFEQKFDTPQVPLQNLNGSPSYYIVLAVDTNNVIAESDETNNANQGLQGVDAAMVTITPKQPSSLVMGGVSVTPNTVAWGGSISVQATVQNKGPGAAPATNARVIVAPRNADPFGPSGYTIGTIAIPEIAGYQSAGGMQTFNLPTDPPSGLANQSSLIVLVVPDGGEVANPVVTPYTYQGQGIDWAALTVQAKASPVTTAQMPDLKLMSVQNPAAVAWGQTFTLKATVENQGAKDVGPFNVRFYLVQGDGTNAPTLALGDATVNGLAVNGTQEVSQTVKLPAKVPAGLDPALGVARIVAKIDPDRTLDESRLDNNVLASAPVALQVVGTDGSTTPVVITPAPADPVPQGSTQTPTNPGQGQGTGSPTQAQQAQQQAQQKAQRQAQRQLVLQQRRLQMAQARAAAQQRRAQLRILRADRPNLRVVYPAPHGVTVQGTPDRPFLKLLAARQAGSPNRPA